MVNDAYCGNLDCPACASTGAILARIDAALGTKEAQPALSDNDMYLKSRYDEAQAMKDLLRRWMGREGEDKVK